MAYPFHYRVPSTNSDTESSSSDVSVSYAYAAVALRRRLTARTRASCAILNSIVRPNSDALDSADNTKELAPSLEACAELQHAYTYFNDYHWDGRLPSCMIVYTRRKNCLGYFAPDRFRRIDGVEVAELALHAGHLAARDDRESLSTLVHEMAHVWRHYLGPLSRNGERVTNGYHDLHWAREMLRVGLVPYALGCPDGKMTGYRVSHRIQDGGAFDEACRQLLDSGFQINWGDRIVRPKSKEGPPKKAAKKDRIKFTCQTCGLNAWAKPTARLECGTCRVPLKRATVLA
ncbi:MAG: SprT-like domain-containing protein [Pseudomonadota bacterium]